MNNLMKFMDEGKANPLVKRFDLLESAYKHFSEKPYYEASINVILNSIKMNKGSFYYKFYDKRDLYLCLLSWLENEKLSFLTDSISKAKDPGDFFCQLRQIAVGLCEYCEKDPRYSQLCRHFLTEKEILREASETDFPYINSNLIAQLVDNATATGQLSAIYDKEFTLSVIKLYFNNIDKFVDMSAPWSQKCDQIDKVISVIKQSIEP